MSQLRTGWWGLWGALVGASISTAALGAVFGVVTGKTAVPHGPSMIVATTAVVLWKHFFP